MNNSYFFSVIIPNFNHGKYLEKRINCILNQTYRNFEVIILDDCSTDNSRDIIEKYRTNDKVSQIVYNEFNSGSPFRQWKKGFKLAKGEWIWIAESDDLCETNFLEVLTSQIEEKISLVTCRTEQIDENGNLIQPGYFLADDVQPGRWHTDFENDGISEINLALKYRCSIPNASAVIFHKSLTKHVESSLGFKAAGDWLFWINCFRDIKFKYVAQPLAFHRFHSHTTRSQKSLEQEKNRMYEFLSCINLAYKIVSDAKQVSYIDLKQYEWLYTELFKRDIKLKEVLNFKNIPIKFAFGYWKFINKKTKKYKKIPQKIKFKLLSSLTAFRKIIN